MLTGMLSPTSGYAKIGGKDIRTNMNGIRQGIGICLQHDCLFPDLTVREHVAFFARIKGMYSKMSYAEAEAKIDASIEDVALGEKRNTLSRNLSGGMKRKLSVAVAFCGDSETVLLDEPTSGMVSDSYNFEKQIPFFSRNELIVVLFIHFSPRRTLSREDSLGMSFVSTDKIDASFLQHILWTKVSFESTSE